MRTLVLSDLHLGSSTRADVLRRPDVLERLVAELVKTDRLVLLGDVLELRHGPLAGALQVAAPILTQIGDALPADAKIVIVAGNHDHEVARPWLEARRRPLGLEQQIKPATASPLARRLAGMLGPKRVTLAYPGIWLRDDVYALHGHYLDVHTRVPTFERLAAGVMTRIVGGLEESGPPGPDSYERILAPLYAWIHASAQSTVDGKRAAGADSAGRAYEALHGDGRRPMRMRVMLAALPVGVRGLTLLGLGSLSGDLSGPGLLSGSLSAIDEVVGRLEIDAEHVIFGHSHRPGPLRNDDLLEWRTASGSWLHNTGSWVHEPSFTGATGSRHAYWPGSAIRLEDQKAPKLVRLLDGVKL